MINMNNHDRILKALNHEEADRIATTSQSIEPPFIARFDSFRKVAKWRKWLVPHWDLVTAQALGLDSKWYHTGNTAGPHIPRPAIPAELQKYTVNRTISSGGMLHERNSQGGKWYVDGILKTPELLKEWIEYRKQFHAGDIRRVKWFAEKVWRKWINKNLVPIPTVGATLYEAWAAIGMDRFGYMMRKYPQLVSGLIDTYTKLTIEQHIQYFENGIDMMYMCDDQAFKDRHMISPTQWEQFVLPSYTEIAKNAHKYNAKLILHTDGYLMEVAPLLVRAGIDAMEPLEYEAGNRLRPLKEKFGDKMTFIGNVAASDIICLGTVEDTIKATKQCILDAGEGGGLIISAGANILAYAKVENVLAMIETVKKYGTYPLNKSNLTE